MPRLCPKRREGAWVVKSKDQRRVGIGRMDTCIERRMHIVLTVYSFATGPVYTHVFGSIYFRNCVHSRKACQKGGVSGGWVVSRCAECGLDDLLWVGNVEHGHGKVGWIAAISTLVSYDLRGPRPPTPTRRATSTENTKKTPHKLRYILICLLSLFTLLPCANTVFGSSAKRTNINSIKAALAAYMATREMRTLAPAPRAGARDLVKADRTLHVPTSLASLASLCSLCLLLCASLAGLVGLVGLLAAATMLRHTLAFIHVFLHLSSPFFTFHCLDWNEIPS